MKQKILSMMILAAIILAVVPAASAYIVSVNDYDPKPAEAGKYLDVWINVENPTTEDSGELFLEITPKDGLELSSGEDARKRVGYLQPYSSTNIEYRLFVKDDAQEGTNNIAVKVLEKQFGEENTALEDEVGISVTERDVLETALDISKIDSDPTRIKPGDENVKLDVTILNIGDATAQNLKAELVNLPDGITLSQSYSGTDLVGNIAADSSAKASFVIDVDESVKPEEHLARLKLTYKYKPDASEDDYIIKEDFLTLKIPVRPVPLYQIVNVKTIPESITVGDNPVLVTITIKNVGEEEGDAVRIKAYGKSEQPITFEDSSDYIAPELKPGQEGQGTLEMKIKDNAQLQEYLIDLEIINEANGDVLTYRKTFPIKVDNPKQNSPIWLILIGVVVIAVFVAILIIANNIKKRKKLDAQKVKSHYGQSYLKKLSEDKKTK